MGSHICGAQDGCVCKTCDKAWKDWAMLSYTYTTQDVSAEPTSRGDASLSPWELTQKDAETVKGHLNAGTAKPTIPCTPQEPEQREAGVDFAKLRRALEENHFTYMLLYADRLIDMAERCDQAEKAATTLKERLECREKQFSEAVQIISNLKSERDCIKAELAKVTERCEKAEREHDRVAKEFAKVQDTLDLKSYQAKSMRTLAVQRAEECDRLKAELAAIRSGTVGLSEEEKSFLQLVRKCVYVECTQIGPAWGRKLLDIIIRLSARQPTLPWVRVVDGKRPDGLDEDTEIAVVYLSESYPGAAIDEAGEWEWDQDDNWVIRLADLLATLPKDAEVKHE